MIYTSYKNAPTCVLLSTFKTDPQLHAGSARLGVRRGSWQLWLPLPSHLGWIQIRSQENNWIHITEIRSLTLASLSTLSALSCRRKPSSLLQECPGAGLYGGCTSCRVAAGKDIHSARKKMSLGLLGTHHHLPTLAVILQSQEGFSFSGDAPPHLWFYFPCLLIPPSLLAAVIYIGVYEQQW